MVGEQVISNVDFKVNRLPLLWSLAQLYTNSNFVESRKYTREIKKEDKLKWQN